MSIDLPTQLQPWPVLLAFAMELDGIQIVNLMDRTGLTVDWALDEKEDYSAKTRRRAYRPRIDIAYQALEKDQKLRAAWILLREIVQRHPALEDDIRSRLSEIGWSIESGKLTPGEGSVRVTCPQH